MEVRAVRRQVGIALVFLVLAVAVSTAAATSTLYGTRFKAGETVQFKIEDSTIWWWGCCSCPETSVLGWHITNSAGQTIYNAVNDAPVPVSSWIGTWAQVDADGNPGLALGSTCSTSTRRSVRSPVISPSTIRAPVTTNTGAHHLRSVRL